MSRSLPVIYWINLERSTGRRQRMDRRLRERCLENVRVEGVDGRNAEETARTITSRAKSSYNAACIASHLRAMRRALEDGHTLFILMEDDVTFEPYDAWADGYSTIAGQLPPHFSALALSVAEHPKYLDALFQRPHLVHALARRAYWSAGAYLMTRAGAESLLEAYARGDRFDVTAFTGHHHAYEVIMRTLQGASMPGPYVARIPLFLFEAEDSEIHPEHLDEHRLARDYLLRHYRSLIDGTYRPVFGFGARLSRALAALSA